MTHTPEPSVRSLLAALDFPAAWCDRSERLQEVNEALVRELAARGRSRADLVDRPLQEVDALDESVRELLRKARTATPLRLAGVPAWRPGEAEHRLLDVESFPSPAGWLLLLRPSGTVSAGMQRRRRSDRLAMLGMIAAGVAHDLNNQLSATLNIAVLLRDDLGDAPRHRRALDIIESSAKEAAHLAHRLLHFAGRAEPELESVDVVEVAERAALLVRHELPPGERFRRELERPAGKVQGDAVQVEQIVVAQLLAAATTLREEGNLTLRVRAADAAPAEAADPRPTAASCVAIEVEHDAEGFEPEAADALAEAAAIARDLGGSLTASAGARGLTRVTLPCAGEPGRPQAAQPPVAAAAAPHTATVLVVDDDPMVREVALAMVRRLGYRALGAASGHEVLDLLRAGEPVALLILDLVMSDMDGIETLRRVREHLPDVKVLVSSGMGAANLPGLAGGSLAVSGHLEKPYSLATLRAALERVLG